MPEVPMKSCPVVFHARALALACAAALAVPPAPATGQAAPVQAAARPAAGMTYSVVNLGIGWPTAIPKINNRGQVAFSVRNFNPRNDLGYRALFYDGATIRDVGNVGFSRSFAAGLNDAGEVVGRSQYCDTDILDVCLHAFRWTARAGIADLGALPQTVYSAAWAVNNQGTIAGESYFNGRLDERYHAVRWSPAGSITDLGTFFGSSSASAINDAGQIAGGVGFADGNTRAFFWTAARGMLDLGSLGSGQSTPVDMNAYGQIAGDSPLVNGGESHAFFWRPGRHMIDLGTLGGSRSRAVDINNGGQVVGASTTASGQEHGFIWNGGGRIADLGTLAGRDTTPRQVNDHGVAVGLSLLRNGRWHGFSWTRARGIADLNNRLGAIPNGLVVEDALGIGNDGTIVASSNAGLVVLKPGPARDAAPLVGPMVNAASARVNKPLDAVIHFLDIDRGERHRASWDWGDGSKPEPARVRERGGAGSITGSHTFREDGDYVVVLTVSDSAGHQSSSVTLVSVCAATADTRCNR
jgi:probable HAF family extracellular repeat protein